MWFNVRDMVDPEWENYKDIDFVGWEAVELVLKAFHAKREEYESVRLPVVQLPVCKEQE